MSKSGVPRFITPLELARKHGKNPQTIYNALSRLGIVKMGRDFLLTPDVARQVENQLHESVGRPSKYEGVKPWDKEGISRQTWYARQKASSRPRGRPRNTAPEKAPHKAETGEKPRKG